MDLSGHGCGRTPFAFATGAGIFVLFHGRLLFGDIRAGIVGGFLTSALVYAAWHPDGFGYELDEWNLQRYPASGVTVRWVVPTFMEYPRRIVELPDGSNAMVAVRRNTSLRGPEVPYLNNLLAGVAFAIEHVQRATGRDRSWRVEVFLGVDMDNGGTPGAGSPDHLEVGEDRAAACDLAEEVCRRLRAEGAAWLAPPANGGRDGVYLSRTKSND